VLTVILLECALELVPSEISSFKDVQKQAGRKGKKSNEILLDQTYHGRAMTKLLVTEEDAQILSSIPSSHS